MQPIFIQSENRQNSENAFYMSKQQISTRDFAQVRAWTLLSLLARAVLPVYATEHVLLNF